MTKLRRIALPIIATRGHCDNNCPAIVWATNGLQPKCGAFGKKLRWDKKKQYNGYRRLEACREAELVK